MFEALYYSRMKIILNRTIISLVFMGTIAGCTASTRPIMFDHIKLERIDSSSANITHAYLKHAEGQLILRGDLKRKLNKRGVLPGHLHVEVIDSSNTMIDESIVCYKLKCANTGTSSFVYKASENPDKIKIIRMVHHNDHSHAN